MPFNLSGLCWAALGAAVGVALVRALGLSARVDVAAGREPRVLAVPDEQSWPDHRSASVDMPAAPLGDAGGWQAWR